jgi:flagellar biosynthesis protein FliQ
MFDQIEATGNWSSVYMLLEYRGVDTSVPGELTRADVDMTVLVPAYMLSELKVGFLMGFRVYLPFLVIDMVIASILISMSMMMLPPVLISLPFKLLLFVLVDGWTLVVGSLLESFVQDGDGAPERRRRRRCSRCCWSPSRCARTGSPSAPMRPRGPVAALALGPVEAPGRAGGGLGMYDESAVYIVRETLLMALMISAPILLAGVVIGLLISLVQSVTSIQDQTLTFVPKIAVMIVVAAVLLPWIVQLVEFAARMFTLF